MAPPLTIISLFLFFFFSISLGGNIPTTTSTIFPSNNGICKGSTQDCAKSSFKDSFSTTQNLLSSIDSSQKISSTLSKRTILALQDCKSLTELNIDYLSQTMTTTNTNFLHSNDAHDLLSLLSAILTNLETCVDGLIETSTSSTIMNGLSTPLSNAKKHYATTLALFKQGWIKDISSTSTNGRFLSESKNTFQIPKIYGRKLLEAEIPQNMNVTMRVTVNPDGTGDFKTINEAVDAAPDKIDSSKGYFVIYIVAGVYEELVSISKQKKNLMMIGDGIDKTIITGSRNVVDGSTTFSSATFAVSGRNFIAKDITFQNTAGPTKHQAVAVLNHADMSTFYRCSFVGYQDTLYAHSLRQFYRECDIYGTIDFIFGNSASVFQNCNIFPRKPSDNQFNAITAQGRTDPNQNTGISIHNCTIKATTDLQTSTIKTYLGRPWKEYSRTVYVESSMDNLIDPAGWREWSGDFAISTLYYAEGITTGAGSRTNERVKWPGYHGGITVDDASKFTVSNFILLGDEWLSKTGVPFTAGLISAP
ncbi:hypothetical protein ACFE04_007479 [Oxalis oulophora]